jgi:hypothetical protein
VLSTSSKSSWILNYSKDSRKTDLTELWSDRLLEILIRKAPEPHFGQGLLHGDFQRLDYELGDTHTPYPNIEEDMEFTTVLIVKQKLEDNLLKSEN